MGINFIVVKGDERNFIENRTLDELIRKCDVVSINVDPISDKEALEEEKLHRDFIFMNHDDRRAALRATRKADDCLLPQLLSSEKRKPIICLERYADEEEVKKMVIRGRSIREAYTSIDLMRGDYLTVLHKLFSNLSRDVKYTSQRDSNMVENAYLIHQKIVSLYPHLNKKQQLHYLVVVHRLHRIEERLQKISNSNVQTIDLILPNVPLWWGHEPFMKIAEENASFEDCEEILARAVLSKIYKLAIGDVNGHYLLQPLCNAAVRSLGVENLDSLNSRINPDASRTEKIEVFRQFFSGMGIELPGQLRDYNRLFKKYSSK